MTEFEMIMNAIEREGMEIIHFSEHENGNCEVYLWRVCLEFRPDGTLSSISHFD